MCELVGILVEMAGPTLFNKAHDRSEIRPSEIFLHFEIRTMNYDAVIIVMKEFESAPRNMHACQLSLKWRRHG